MSPPDAGPTHDEEHPAPGDGPVLIVRGATVITMDADGRVLHDAAVVCRRGAIVDVTSWGAARRAHPRAEVLGGPDVVVTPGLINAHQHVTADPLFPSTVPDDLASSSAIFDWAVPFHTALTPADDACSTRLAAAESLRLGTTTLIEAGTVAHPEVVAAGLREVGVRARYGCWGWDVDASAGPLAGPVDEVLSRAEALLDADGSTAEAGRGGAASALVRAGVRLVGHDLMSEELLVGASELARERGVGLSFHLSPTAADAEHWRRVSGRAPLVRFAELGALGPHVLVAHAVHLDDDEIDAIVDSQTAIASCPWAYLRLGQGLSAVGRHDHLIARGARLALGCDAQNAGDDLDVLLAARLFAGLFKDARVDPTAPGAAVALGLATAVGAEAVGLGAVTGALVPGLRADVVVRETTAAGWSPPGDPVLQLVWATSGRDVTDVVVDGQVVVRDGQVATVDLGELRAEAAARRGEVMARAGLPTGT